MISSLFINQGCHKAGEMEIKLGNFTETESINPNDVTLEWAKTS